MKRDEPNFEFAHDAIIADLRESESTDTAFEKLSRGLRVPDLATLATRMWDTVFLRVRWEMNKGNLDGESVTLAPERFGLSRKEEEGLAEAVEVIAEKIKRVFATPWWQAFRMAPGRSEDNPTEEDVAALDPLPTLLKRFARLFEPARARIPDRALETAHREQLNQLCLWIEHAPRQNAAAPTNYYGALAVVLSHLKNKMLSELGLAWQAPRKYFDDESFYSAESIKEARRRFLESLVEDPSITKE
jgi:hypothetical protein